MQFLTAFDNFLRHWLQSWQLRTWIHDNHCDLTMKSDTGQHLQFLWCLKSFYYYIWFHFPGVSFHSNFPRLSATARVHINPRTTSKHVRLGNTLMLVTSDALYHIVYDHSKIDSVKCLNWKHIIYVRLVSILGSILETDDEDVINIHISDSSVFIIFMILLMIEDGGETHHMRQIFNNKTVNLWSDKCLQWDRGDGWV